MPLEQYRRKRDFTRTPEPAGGLRPSPPGAAGRFVVQRHRATRLHYDFRLEIGGVLVSWAVPKGPTLDPGVRRMAVHVEDHPVDYFDFEGVIPTRQYGAGDVIVWDWGTFRAEGTEDPAAALAAGELKFRLEGEKLRGRFTIVRTGPGERRRRPGSRAADDAARTSVADMAAGGDRDEGDGDQWLLIKKRDEAAEAGWNPEDHPQSAKTGRTNDEVKANRDAVWSSSAPAASAEIDLSAAVEAPLPAFVEPMAATLATRPFSDPDWLFEIKWDGYRVEAVVRDGTVRTFTRNGRDAATYFPGFLEPPSWIDAHEAIVDGEIVALDPDGNPSFELLQAKISRAAAGEGTTLVYEAFDILHLDGRSLLAVPLEERKRLLRSVLRQQPRVRYAGHVVEDGEAFFRAAAERGLEGILAKHRRSRYEPGRRSRGWLKLKARSEQEFVVGGYLTGEGNAKDLGALLVGYQEDGRLRYAGRVGSGFDGRTRRDLRDRLDATRRDDAPFDPAPPLAGDLRAARWVEPVLVIRARFSNWTRDGLIGQSSYRGLELDRDPRAVVRETATEWRTAERAAEAEIDAAAPLGPREPGGRSAGPTRRRPAAAGSPAAGSPAAGSPAAGSPAAPPGTSGHGAGRVSDEELAALDAMGAEGIWHVDGQALKLSNLDKELFPPAAGDPSGPITKRELIRYFARIAPVMLPHLAERPLNLHRYPNGTFGPGFWQKDIPRNAPSWLRRWHETGVSNERDANEHLVADRPASLAWLANQAAFEIHAWTSRLDDIRRPTYALVDIDPGARTTWEECLVIARLYRAAFEHLHVTAFAKLTGRRGIQAWIPVVPRYTFAETSAWVEAISRAVGATVPDLVSWEWSVAERRGRARLDFTQNASIKTLVAPYAVRPAAGAPVSAPIAWDELDDPDLRPDRWTIRDLPDRVARRGDLFAGALTEKQELPKL